MLNVAYPDTPSPRDVDPGDIEEVARQKWQATSLDLYEGRQNARLAVTADTLALLEPETVNLLQDEARRGCVGGDWDVPAPWVDLGGTPDRQFHRAHGRPIYGPRRRP